MSKEEREPAEVEGQAGRIKFGNEEAPENPQETTGEGREDDDPEVEGQVARIKY